MTKYKCILMIFIIYLKIFFKNPNKDIKRGKITMKSLKCEYINIKCFFLILMLKQFYM